MENSNFYVLMIWINDDPVKGNAVRIRQVVEPRKAYEEYKVGEKVKVKLPRFGIVDGVIGKIGDGSDETKRDMDKLIDSPEFITLVQKLCYDSEEEKTTVEKPVVEQSRVSKDVKKTPAPGSKSAEKTPASASKSAKRTPVLAGKRQAEDKLPKKSSEKKKKYDLEAAAQLLELSSLREKISNSSSEKMACSSTPETPERTNSPGSPSSPESPSLLMSPPSRQTSLTTPNGFTPVNAAQSTNSETASFDGGEPTSSIVRKSLNMVTNQSYTDLLNDGHRCSCSAEVAALNSYIQWLENRMSTELASMRTTISWLYQEVQMKTQNTTIPNAKEPAVPSPRQQVSDSCQLLSDKTSKSPSPPAPTQEESEGRTYNNYSKTQLRGIMEKEKTFSKAAKSLFRRMFSAEECQGRSLKGSAPNRNTPAKPALEDQDKLSVLYDLVQEKWAFANRALINTKLADLLKPSFSGSAKKSDN